MKTYLKKAFLVVWLSVFAASGAISLAPAPQASADTVDRYAITSGNIPETDGDLLKKLNDAAGDDKSKTSVFGNLFVMAGGGAKNSKSYQAWGGSEKFEYKDAFDSSRNNFRIRYTASYYCYDGKPSDTEKVGVYGTTRIGVSVYVFLKKNSDFGKDKAFDAIATYSSIEFTPKKGDGVATGEAAQIWLDKEDKVRNSGAAYAVDMDGNPDTSKNIFETNDVVLKYGYSSMEVDEKNGLLPGDTVRLETKNGTDLLKGCGIEDMGRGIHDDRGGKVNNLLSNKISDSVKSKWQAVLEILKDKNGGEDVTGNAAGEEISVPACEASGLSLSWLTCAVINGLGEMADMLKDKLAEQLNFGSSAPKSTTEPGGVFCTAGTPNTETCTIYEKAWSNMRNIALGLMVLAGLIVLGTQMLGMELFSAYDVRKTLPRILVAALAITLSWEILRFATTLFNDLGAGIGSLMQSPFADLESANFADQGWFVDQFIAGAAIYSVVGVFGVLALVTMVVLSLFVAFITIILRNILLTILIIFAPIAIAAYILPNTEKYFKLWKDNFIKASLMYLIIMAMLSAGAIFSKIGGVAEGTFTEVVGLVAYFAPYLLVPAAFRMAGGVMSSFGNMAATLQKKGVQPATAKMREGDMRRNKKARAGQLLPGNNKFSRGVNTAIGAAVSPRVLLGGDPRKIAGRAKANAYSGALNFGAATLEKDATYQANKGDDSFQLALANRDLAKQKRDAAKARGDHSTAASYQRAIDQASLVKGSSDMGVRLHALNELAKTGYQFAPGEAGYAELHDTVTSIVGNDPGSVGKAMDTAQYFLKGAGRSDLGGIDHATPGSVRDKIKSGVKKIGPYQRGQGKADTYKGMAQGWLGSGALGADGKTLESGAMAQHIDRAMASGEVTAADLAEYHGILLGDMAGATTTNKAEIQKQLAGIEQYASSLNAAPTPDNMQEINNRTALIQALENNRRSMRSDIPEAEKQNNK